MTTTCSACDMGLGVPGTSGGGKRKYKRNHRMRGGAMPSLSPASLKGDSFDSDGAALSKAAHNLYVKQNKTDEGIIYLRKAYELDKTNINFILKYSEELSKSKNKKDLDLNRYKCIEFLERIGENKNKYIDIVDKYTPKN